MFFLLCLLLSSFHLVAQNRYTISGKINIPNKEDENEISTVITIEDSTGNIIGGTLDSALYFEINGVENGRYKLSLKSSNDSTERFDTTLILNNNSINNLELHLKTVCSVFTEEIAKSDIAQNNIRLIMEPGFVHFRYSHKEKRIKKKYHIEYVWSGCLRFTHHSCLKAYNRVVFDYLDQTYGTKWRTNVIDKVVGLHSH